MNAASRPRSRRLPRVSAFSFSYASATPWRRITCCTASASTSQFASRSAASRARAASRPASPLPPPPRAPPPVPPAAPGAPPAGGLEPGEPLRARRPGEQRVAERRARVPERGRVREIALPARHRELLREGAQQRGGDPDVALGVLEVDRVHLVRHGGGSDLAFFRLLSEIAERDVAPQVAVQVEQHAVGARIRVEQLRVGVVRLDLRGVRVELQPEPLPDSPAP